VQNAVSVEELRTLAQSLFEGGISKDYVFQYRDHEVNFAFFVFCCRLLVFAVSAVPNCNFRATTLPSAAIESCPKPFVSSTLVL